ncbi:MAG: 2-hydroxyacid dehydrogenase [Clostridiaceae bacterium]
MIPSEAIELLENHFDVEINPLDRVLDKEELIEKVKGRDAVLCLLTDNIDEEVFKAAGRNCKIFANYAVGYNNIDVETATKHNIMITNTPGVLNDATADLAWTLLFSTARRVVEADKYLRDGLYKGWSPMLFLGQDITGKTLGVVGTGRIGSNFAKKALGFDMKIIYSDIKRNEEFEKLTNATYVDFETLLKEADFVSLHVPLLSSTTHLIGEKELKLMKKTAILINTSRGPVVDEKALANALKYGEIWGAGLDVYEEEPKVSEELIKLNNAVLLPHIASATIETRTNMGIIAASNIVSAYKGEIPENIVNKEVLD